MFSKGYSQCVYKLLKEWPILLVKSLFTEILLPGTACESTAPTHVCVSCIFTYCYTLFTATSALCLLQLQIHIFTLAINLIVFLTVVYSN